MSLRHGVILLLLASAAAAARGQIVQGQVQSIGFPGGRGSIYRDGQWLPIQVHLAVQGTDFFAGELRVTGVDLDGDRVEYTRQQVNVAPNVVERVWCYVNVNGGDELPRNVDVLDARGNLVTRFPMPPQGCDTLRSEDLLVLDISSQPVKAFDRLTTAGWQPGDAGTGVREHYRNIVMSPVPARDLPDRWWGLEAVDVIVWDRPDRGDLSLQQLDTLIQWVRNGGQLVVGIGGGWEAMQKKAALADIMPFAHDAPTIEVTQLSVFLKRMAFFADRLPTFDHPVELTTAGLASDALRTLGDYGPSGTINLIAMREVGSGRVVATAASLRDLTSPTINIDRFFGELVDLNRYTAKFKENELEQFQNMLEVQRPLYPAIVDRISFKKGSTLGGLTAFLFIAGYIAIATLASWWWLVRRKRTDLSWVVFAGFAAAASVLSLVTVAAARGVLSHGVATVSVVDLDAGSTSGRGPCLFGYATPIRQTTDLSLPGEGNFLRPLSRGPSLRSFYVTPARYAGVPTQARLENVLMRATLKQLEGYWHGDVGGTVRGDLLLNRRTGRVEAASWLANDLPVGLAGGVLLFIDPRHDEALLHGRAAGVDTLYASKEGVPAVPPACNVLIVQLPAVAAGETVREIGQADYGRYDERWVRWSTDVKPDPKTEPLLPNLWQSQQRWAYGRTLSLTAQTPEEALLLASTFSFFLHGGDVDRLDRFDIVRTPLSTDGLPPLDISHWLVRGQAVLLAWADAPGPAELYRDNKPLRSTGGLTLYRVRLPVRYTGDAQQGVSTP